MRPGQHHVESGLSLAHTARMMNGYLQCACSASFQDLQLLLQEQQGRKPSLLCAAHLLTVMNGSHSCPMQEARGSYGVFTNGGEPRQTGFVRPLGRGRKETQTVLLPIDGAPMCPLTQTLTSPLLQQDVHYY